MIAVSLYPAGFQASGSHSRTPQAGLAIGESLSLLVAWWGGINVWRYVCAPWWFFWESRHHEFISTDSPLDV